MGKKCKHGVDIEADYDCVSCIRDENAKLKAEIAELKNTLERTQASLQRFVRAYEALKEAQGENPR